MQQPDHAPDAVPAPNAGDAAVPEDDVWHGSAYIEPAPYTSDDESDQDAAVPDGDWSADRCPFCGCDDCPNIEGAVIRLMHQVEGDIAGRLAIEPHDDHDPGAIRAEGGGHILDSVDNWDLLKKIVPCMEARSIWRRVRDVIYHDESRAHELVQYYIPWDVKVSFDTPNGAIEIRVSNSWRAIVSLLVWAMPKTARISIVSGDKWNTEEHISLANIEYVEEAGAVTTIVFHGWGYSGRMFDNSELDRDFAFSLADYTWVNPDGFGALAENELSAVTPASFACTHQQIDDPDGKSWWFGPSFKDLPPLKPPRIKAAGPRGPVSAADGEIVCDGHGKSPLYEKYCTEDVYDLVRLGKPFRCAGCDARRCGCGEFLCADRSGAERAAEGDSAPHDDGAPREDDALYTWGRELTHRDMHENIFGSSYPEIQAVRVDVGCVCETGCEPSYEGKCPAACEYATAVVYVCGRCQNAFNDKYTGQVLGEGCSTVGELYAAVADFVHQYRPSPAAEQPSHGGKSEQNDGL